MTWDGEYERCRQIVRMRIADLAGSGSSVEHLAVEAELAARERDAALLDRIDQKLGRIATALEDIAATWAKPPGGRT